MKKILIVDDLETRRVMYGDFFSENECISLSFSVDGIDAYHRCIIEKFDAIILDHEMPRLKGLDFLVALRNTAGTNQFTPVIVVSAYLPEFHETAKIFKDVLFLNKLFDLKILGAHLNDLFSSEP